MPRRPGLTAGALGPTCALFVHIDTAATPERGSEGGGRGKGYIANQNTCMPGNAGGARSGYASCDKCPKSYITMRARIVIELLETFKEKSNITMRGLFYSCFF